MPEGSLTAAQYEILEAVWTCGRKGAAVAEIWQAICERKDVARTTVLNLVDRLEKRGWLKRRSGGGVNRFFAAVSRKKADSLLAGEFVDSFFGGSASELVMSLLGSDRVDPAEIKRLREILRSHRSKQASNKPAEDGK